MVTVTPAIAKEFVIVIVTSLYIETGYLSKCYNDDLLKYKKQDTWASTITKKKVVRVLNLLK